MKKVLLTLILIASFFAEAQYITTNSEVTSQSEGILYSLPRNVIKVEFTIQQTNYHIGPYAEFASKILGTDNYIKENKSVYKIQNVDLEIFSQADPNTSFIVSLDEKSKEQGALRFSMTEDGVITSFGLEQNTVIVIPEYRIFNETVCDALVEVPEVRFVDFIVKKEDDEDDQKSATKSLTKEEKARLIVAKIAETRGAYFDLITGYQEVAYGNTLNFMAEKTQEFENEYYSLFVGKKTEMTYKKTFFITPEQNQKNASITIAKFSENEGFTSSNSKSGSPVKIQFETKSTLDSANSVNISDTNNSLSNRIIYRTPASSKVKVAIDNKTIAEQQMKISQYGCYMQAPINNYKLVFDPNTGQLVKISK